MLKPASVRQQSINVACFQPEIGNVKLAMIDSDGFWSLITPEGPQRSHDRSDRAE